MSNLERKKAKLTVDALKRYNHLSSGGMISVLYNMQSINQQSKYDDASHWVMDVHPNIVIKAFIDLIERESLEFKSFMLLTSLKEKYEFVRWYCKHHKNKYPFLECLSNSLVNE